MLYMNTQHSAIPPPPPPKQLHILIKEIGHTDFFHFMRRFWYHVFTWTWESPRDSARSILSGVDRYFWVSNRFSSPISWSSVKTVRLRRHFLGRRNAEASPGERDRMYTGRGIGRALASGRSNSGSTGKPAGIMGCG